MANIVEGGNTTYGYDIGVLMLDSRFPRIIGDVGNAKTWNFPVLYEVVKGFKPEKVVLNLDMNDIEPFIEAALDLQNKGVRAITTSCGFLAMFQEEMAKRLSIPVFTSALVMLPMLCRMSGKVLVLSANSDTLTQRHLEACCGDLSGFDYKIIGTQHEENFTDFTVHNWLQVDTDLCEQEILSVLHSELDKDDSYKCILLECTNLPPYSDAIRKEFDLPVFDIVTLMNFVHASLEMNDFGDVRRIR